MRHKIYRKKRIFLKRFESQRTRQKTVSMCGRFVVKPLSIYIREDRCEKKAGSRKMM